MTDESNAQPTDLTGHQSLARQPQLLGLARIAVIILDRWQRITHWNQAAHGLFGHGPESVLQRQATTLLAQRDRQRSIFDVTAEEPWCGVAAVTRTADAASIRAACWVYPLQRPGDMRSLLLAVDGELLHRAGIGLTLGDEPVLPPPNATDPPAVDFDAFRVQPVMAPPPPARLDRYRHNIAAILPRMGPGASEQVVDQVLEHGYPTLHADVSLHLPVTPYWRQPGRDRHRVASATGPTTMSSTESALEAADARDRLSFLNDASAHIGSTLDLTSTVNELCDMLVPRFADFAGVQLLEEVVADDFPERGSPDADTVMRRVAVAHNDEPGRWEDTVPVGEILQLPAQTPFVRCMTTGKAVHVAHVDAELSATISAQFDNRDLRPLIGGRALLIAPLIARGTVLGNFILLRKRDRCAFDDMDVATAEELARRAAVSIDNARLYRYKARIASTLQRSMLPETPPDLPGVEVTHRYLPSSQAEVGGDWFDAIAPRGRVALVVGDVMGHGIQSAAVMGQFRTAVRTLAALDMSPAQVLQEMDELAQQFGDQGEGDLYLATCIFAVYDPVARTLEVANAGHIPPVYISPYGQSELLDVPPGPPVGVSIGTFEARRFEILDGSQLALCTDGLVEVRGQDIGLGLAALCGNLASVDRTLEQTCDAITNALHTEERQDDVALLMARFRSVG